MVDYANVFDFVAFDVHAGAGATVPEDASGTARTATVSATSKAGAADATWISTTIHAASGDDDARSERELP